MATVLILMSPTFDGIIGKIKNGWWLQKKNKRTLPSSYFSLSWMLWLKKPKPDKLMLWMRFVPLYFLYSYKKLKHIVTESDVFRYKLKISWRCRWSSIFKSLISKMISVENYIDIFRYLVHYKNLAELLQTNVLRPDADKKGEQ